MTSGAGERAPGALRVVREAVRNWMHHRAPAQSAALAFYTLVSLTPVLVLVMAVAGSFVREELVRRQVTSETRLLFGSEVATVVEEVLEGAARPAQGLWPALLGAFTLLLGATAVFAQIQEALNAVWEVRPRPGRLLRSLVRKRFLSFGMVLFVGLLLLVLVVASSLGAAIQDRVEERIDVPVALLVTTNAVFSLLVSGALFALLYRTLPDVEIGWRDVLLGAAVAALLFAAGRQVIGAWLGRAGLASAYGAAGSLVAFLLWIYYSSLIFLFGAELSRVWSRRYRAGPAPALPGTRHLTAGERPALEAGG